ncbi:MAG: hypothetical protein ABIY55_35130 [Kofleriaceae bacterium]
MTTRFVHAMTAAAVEDPALIVQWRAEPALLRAYGVEPDSVDLEALWRFAGLTVKLRHKALRDQLPATFRMIGLAGLDVELFAAFASERAARGLAFATTTEGRADDLMAFLGGWLDRSDSTHALLWDVIRHERALARLGRAAPAVGSSPNLPSPLHITRPPPTASAVPRVLGEIVRHEMTSDPRAITRALNARTPVATIPRTPGFLCYWRAEGSPQVTILRLDELGYYALGMVDGVRTAAGVYLGLGGKGRPHATFLRLLGELATLGVIALRPR